jgi:hypothetical protein
MTYSTKDSSWATSSKGNLWRRLDGQVLIVGEKKNGRYWARRGQDFLKGDFGSEQQAMYAAEHGASGEQSNFDDDDTFWDKL